MSDNVQITFEHFGITSILFNINSNFKKENEVTVNPEMAGRTNYNKETGKLQAFMKVSLNSGNLPFYLTVEGFGVFTFDGEPDKHILKNISSINAPAIIFPYIRETIADITRRAGFPPLHLPPVNFVNLAKKGAQSEIQKHSKKEAEVRLPIRKIKVDKELIEK